MKLFVLFSSFNKPKYQTRYYSSFVCGCGCVANIQAGKLQLLDILKHDGDLALRQSLVYRVSGVRTFNIRL